ncbi:ROK family protein [Prevotella sp. tf2-5]|uniref:ROK family protein n=1 Tax=Prevotella sp. tf2-5 TaxID=1761889 RepID=UPI0008EA0A70|nr:ROK family protein [Prevotella sp. tf2-5]SFO81388.1 glucokinase [Prevotella sp. tf2-5]
MIDNNFKTKVIGVDIRVDRTVYALVNIRGEVLARDEIVTSDYPVISDFVTKLSEKIVLLMEANGGFDSVRSIGVSAPSGNFHTGCIENSPNLPWKGIVPLAAMLRDRMGLAVAVDNNANVIAMAEHAFGAAHGLKDFVLVNLGSGMGSCIYSKGVIYQGTNGFSGEIGHTTYIAGGRQCGCGKQGCLEAYTASKGVLQTAKEVLEEYDTPSLMRQSQQLTVKQIVEFCHEGDQLAIEVMRRTGHALGVGLANYASLFNPEAIILSGAVSKAGKWLLEPTDEAFEEHVFHNMKGKIKLVCSLYEDRELIVLGASVLAWTVKEYSLFK